MSTAVHDQDGFTLIETLIAVALLAVGVFAVLGALQVGVASSVVQRDLATSELLLREAAEQVKRADYDECATDYPLSVDPPDEVTVTVEEISYWLGPDDPEGFDSSCSVGDDRGLQLVVLRVEGLETTSAMETSIVKRQPR